MTKTLKFWTGLGVAALSGAMVAEAAALDIAGKAAQQGHGKLLLLADASGEGGEGGEGAAAKDEGRIGYLTSLGLVEGHMRVGIELYKKGDLEAAKTHMKHPADELYAGLKPHFAELKVKDFDSELEAVAAAVGKGAPAPEVDQFFGKLQAAIAAARGGDVSSHDIAEVAEHLVRTAAEEYAVGVKAGQVTDAHEYQDAWGFVQAAKALLAGLPEDERKEHAGPLGEMEAELEKIQALWPDITGKSPVSADPTLLPAAAARIELAALSIK